MAEFKDSLLHLNSEIDVDVNKNPFNTENHLCAADEIPKTVPAKTKQTPQCDITCSGTFQPVESPSNYTERSESNDELNLKNANDDDADGSAFSETLPNVEVTSTTTNCIQVPEVTQTVINNKLDTLSTEVSVDDVNKRNSDSGIHDSVNNIVEDTNMIDFTEDILNMSNDCRGMIIEFNNEENCVQVKDEEFHDAVQFFKDPSSFTFLENAGSTSASSEPLITRSSLYVNFDPLHAKFYSQSTSNELQDIVENDTGPEVSTDGNQNDNMPDVVNKHLVNVSPRESLGNILISFDSPLNNKDNQHSIENNSLNEPQKLYTEEELQQALKVQELSLQETFLKNQQELELTRSQKQQELETTIQRQNHLCKTYHCLLKEITDLAIAFSEKEKMLYEKLEMAEREKNKLKEDLRTSVEDLQSVENTFSDFHKRYEQCKNMLKMYTQNEDNLKLQLENMRNQLQEKEEMYKALQSRTEEMLDKANIEVASIKKSGDAQVAVLTAQLKKAELKISSLESDVKHVKIENGKLSSICDELMAKVSEG